MMELKLYYDFVDALALRTTRMVFVKVYVFILFEVKVY